MPDLDNRRMQSARPGRRAWSGGGDPFGRAPPAPADGPQSDAPPSEETGTQLADRAPRIGQPLRILAPTGMKAPERRGLPTQNETVEQEAFSPTAHSRRARSRAGLPRPATSTGPGASHAFGPREGAGERAHAGTSDDMALRRRIHDGEMLAAAARRAGRHRGEGAAYFANGVLYDNIGDHARAIDQYKSFLRAAVRTADPALQSLALNCIGVDLHVLAAPAEPPELYSARGPQQGQQRPPASGAKPVEDLAHRRLRQAVIVHERHMRLADQGGQFVACVNMGVACLALRQFEEASQHCQHALRLAIALRSTQAQCLAVGNLGLAALANGDTGTARACLGQHLQLTRTLGDKSAEAGACLRIGVLASARGEYDEACRFFLESRRIASQIGEHGVLKEANCNLGVAQGNLRMRDHVEPAYS